MKFMYGLVSKLFCAAFKEIPQVYVPVRSLWGLQVKKYAHVSARLLPVFLPHPWGGLCLRLLPPSCFPHASVSCQLHHKWHEVYVPSTSRVRSEYVPMAAFFWLFFVPQSSSGLPFCPSCLLSINVRPWPGLCPPPCSCTFHSAFHISNSTFRYVLYGGRTQKWIITWGS